MSDNVRQAVPFFWVHDLERSLRFYVDGLGCTRTKQWIDDGGKMRWCWLDLGQASLMLQEFWADGRHRNLPDGKVGLGVSINLICTDALAIYRELKSRGLAPKRPFVGNGMWVTQISDPDGYQLFFESPTDAPEESELPENEETNQSSFRASDTPPMSSMASGRRFLAPDPKAQRQH